MQPSAGLSAVRPEGQITATTFMACRFHINVRRTSSDPYMWVEFWESTWAATVCLNS